MLALRFPITKHRIFFKANIRVDNLLKQMYLVQRDISILKVDNSVAI